jgi:hypothetical protein
MVELVGPPTPRIGVQWGVFGFGSFYPFMREAEQTSSRPNSRYADPCPTIPPFLRSIVNIATQDVPPTKKCSPERRRGKFGPTTHRDPRD